MSNPTTLLNYYDFKDLDQRGKIIAEYIWIDGSGLATRSKQRTLPKKVTCLEDLPEWNFDGSSTEQAETGNSEVVLKPVAFFPDPFRRGDNVLVMCECWSVDRVKDTITPTNTNFRHYANEIFEKAKDEEAWFGIEQEYTLFAIGASFNKWPLGWPEGGFPGPQGPYYCGAGADVAFGRAVMDAHYKACLYAGVNISGTNGEVMPGQWEYQVGPCLGIEIGDHLWLSRYLLQRVTENFNVGLSFEPKPIKGDWNGAGCHTNFSTKAMRAEGGLDVIVSAIKCLEKQHLRHINVYGDGNDQRLTGKHETGRITDFSYGVADRGGSIRIPYGTNKDGKGYLEDRRPASNIDPYVVGAVMVDTTCLGAENFETLEKHVAAWKEERANAQ